MMTVAGLEFQEGEGVIWVDDEVGGSGEQFCNQHQIKRRRILKAIFSFAQYSCSSLSSFDIR